MTEKQEKFVRLIAQGMGNTEACRMLGVHRNTGIRWRFGSTWINAAGEPVHYPPVHKLAAPRQWHPRYLSLAERNMIADLRREKKTARQIARLIGRSPSTISRELRRNSGPTGRYRPGAADHLATSRRPRPRARRLTADPVLRAVVVGLLAKRWSPEQVAHELGERFKDQPVRESGSGSPRTSSPAERTSRPSKLACGMPALRPH